MERKPQVPLEQSTRTLASSADELALLDVYMPAASYQQRACRACHTHFGLTVGRKPVPDVLPLEPAGHWRLHSGRRLDGQTEAAELERCLAWAAW